MSRRILIVAGEASGDMHGAHLARAYQALDPQVRFFGVGGREMRRAGVDVVFDSAEVAVVGLMEVARHLGRIREILSWVRDAVEVGRPDAVVLIDFPEFNFRVAAAARKAGVPVFYYISPQVWAWRRRRVKFLARNVAKMAVIFPFEVPFYEQAGVPVEFVGHPLLDGDAGEEPNRVAAREALGLSEDETLVAILPGSRRSEVGHHLPTLAAAAARIASTHPQAIFCIPVASTLVAEELEQAWKNVPGAPPLRLVDGQSHTVLAAADAAAVCSGTATLEAACAGVPFVVIYRLSPITYMLGRLLVRVPHVGLANLVAERTVAPELIQGDFTPQAVAEAIGRFLDDETAAVRARADLADVRARLGEPGASGRAAAALFAMLHGETTAPQPIPTETNAHV